MTGVILTGEQVAEAMGWAYEWGWLDRAACKERGPTLFFAYELLSKARQIPALAHAKGVCATCPVRLSCAADAISRREEYGVFGGMSPSERNRVRLSIVKRLGVASLFDGLRSTG